MRDERRGLIARARDFLEYRITPALPAKVRRSRLTSPVASFTFDDFPKSAATTGAAILERHGAVGTFYAAGALCGTTSDGVSYFEREELADLVRRGHEIGDHTFGHIHVPRHGRAEREQDLARNARFLVDTLGDVIATSFAFPFGHASPAAKRFYAARFASCRGTVPGVNSGALDLGQLKAVGLDEAALAAVDVPALLAQARRENGWIIFYTHDVSEQPSRFGTRTATFEGVVRACRDAQIEILPMRNALARACFGP